MVRIAGIIGLLLAPLVVPIATGVAAERICTQDSQPLPVAPFVSRINSASCGTYHELVTRVAATGEPILIRYMVHRPAEKPKALVVLIAGGILETGITGNPATGEVFTAGRNFVVRSAQLFAEHGFLALTINQPLRLTPAPVPEYPTDLGDVNTLTWYHYRTWPAHAFDLVRAVAAVNTDNLSVYLIGTSDGAISAVAQSSVSNGILVSSPNARMSPPFPLPLPTVAGCPPATNCSLYVNHPFVPTLQPNSVQVPVHVLAHQSEACIATSPANSLSLHNAFLAAGVDSRFDQADGGFAVPGESPCGPLHFHGFLGVERAAVKLHARRLDSMLESLAAQFKNNKRPTAAPGAVDASTAYTIDLASLARDGGDTLTYSLPYLRSYRRGTADPTNLALAGSLVTYTPVPGAATDGFTYLVSDGKGGITASYVIVTIGP